MKLLEVIIETDQQVLPEAFLPLFSTARSLRRLAQDFQPGRRTTIMINYFTSKGVRPWWMWWHHDGDDDDENGSDHEDDNYGYGDSDDGDYCDGDSDDGDYCDGDDGGYCDGDDVMFAMMIMVMVTLVRSNPSLFASKAARCSEEAEDLSLRGSTSNLRSSS